MLNHKDTHTQRGARVSHIESCFCPEKPHFIRTQYVLCIYISQYINYTIYIYITVYKLPNIYTYVYLYMYVYIYLHLDLSVS